MSHVLIIEDDADTAEALSEIVRMEGFTVSTAKSLRDANIRLAQHYPDIILIDLSLPDGSGLDFIGYLDSSRSCEIILMTGSASLETAIEAVRVGAADYLVKPVNLSRLRAILARVPKPSDLKAQIGSLRGALQKMGHFGHMLGSSPAMQKLYGQISRVAPTEATVLLVGESGTGKELAAQSIHDLSRRGRQPFLAVNCGAISPNLIESEMFGHERGSFTGAERQHKGYFERAHGGTLFLDEITEMPIELQVKLLRVLETSRFMRIGTTREQECDVRVLAATNRDPDGAVSEGRLRNDLFHRLNVFPISLPPLRTRGDDVEMLANHFLGELNTAGSCQKRFSPAVGAALRRHSWPGNVRELRNFVQRAFILADEEIEPLELADGAAEPAPAEAAANLVRIPVGTSLEEADKCLILATLKKCGGQKKQTAEILGISLKTLYNRLTEYGVQETEPEESA